jgi:hypothetical protein
MVFDLRRVWCIARGILLVILVYVIGIWYRYMIGYMDEIHT